MILTILVGGYIFYRLIFKPSYNFSKWLDKHDKL